MKRSVVGNGPGAAGGHALGSLCLGHVVGLILARGLGDGTGLAYGRIARFIREMLPVAGEPAK